MTYCHFDTPCQQIVACLCPHKFRFRDTFLANAVTRQARKRRCPIFDPFRRDQIGSLFEANIIYIRHRPMRDTDSESNICKSLRRAK